ncbi:Conserved_hypothetical protein [Hexamita inflata]|uniref:Kelch motif family protein n=1 Tax=Hexamita inflata TaxID=28002 RepID=A0AA86UKT9_9EUKA|nr:Conserved hypothetical protein [Hexamita inflata]
MNGTQLIPLNAVIQTNFSLFDTSNAIFFFSGNNAVYDCFRHDKITGGEQFVQNMGGRFRDFNYTTNGVRTFLVSLEYGVIIYEVIDGKQPQLVELLENKENPLYFMNSPPSKRVSFGLGLCSDFLVVFGGEGCGLDRSIYFYSLSMNMWFQQEPDFSTPEWRYNLQMVTFDNTLYILGGQVYDRQIEEVDSFTILNYKEIIQSLIDQEGYIDFKLGEFQRESMNILVKSNVVFRGSHLAVISNNRIIEFDERWIIDCIFEGEIEGRLFSGLENNLFCWNGEKLLEIRI